MTVWSLWGRRTLSRVAAIGIVALFGLTGCRRDDISSYQLPTIVDDEPEPEPPEAAAAGRRTIGAIVPVLEADGEKGYVFFKMMGSPGHVGKRAEAIEALVKGVDFSNSEKSLDLVVEKMPKTWKVTRNRSQFITLTLRTSSVLTPIHLEISLAKGDFAANLNRWRDQLGLPEANEADLKKNYREIKTADGKTAFFVDLAGPGK
jgi:hypothetical protein